MKYTLLFFVFAYPAVLFETQAQTKDPLENVVITPGKKTEVHTNANGELLVNVSKKDMRKFKADGIVRYSNFGATGDGKTDDIDAIAATHAFANEHGLSVKADDNATYYISGKQRTAIIRTNTDFGTAAFVIDDTNVDNRNTQVFSVVSALQSYKPKGISSLKRNQKKVDVSLPATSIITATDSNIKRYIRFGP